MFAASKTSAAVAAPPAGDPYFSSVSLLLHGDGTNGAQNNTFIDSSTNNFTITRNGTPTQGSFSPFPLTAAYDPAVNGGSGIFNGTTDYVTAPANAVFNFGTGDWTVECFFYINGGTSDSTLFALNSGSGSSGLTLCIKGDGVTTGTGIQLYKSTNGTVNINKLITIPQKVWHHVTITKASNTIRFFLDGTQVGTSDTDTTIFGSSTLLATTGRQGWPGYVQYFNGYISNVRVVKGTAVYTANFTPPTAPLTAITNTSLLLNFINAGIYDNATKNNLVTVGNAQVSTAVKKYGTGSMAFDGTGDWLTFADAAAMQLAAGDFTVEGWLYISTTGTAKYIAAKGTSTTGWALGINSSNQPVFNYTSSALTGSTALSATTWYYVTVVRNGSATGNLKIYLDGVVDATSAGAVTDNFNQTNVGYVGADRTGANAMNGYIDDLRITKGVARYTANFTPPTAALPDF